ncbi:uncharacterized protein LOC123514994 [Portunus trituberculatus]|uniref:uncharacterized protein LOC123514994 n=1 Tax=Portunus trituberculatus TaxID=210409 RepID=UPI001E1CE44E|nr:uncharacterized protein LOC123514994 [Portunus trituberculatus]
MHLAWQWWAAVWLVVVVAALTVSGSEKCEDVTIWAETTKFRKVPVTLHRHWMTYYSTNQYLTEFVVSTKSIPYFVTQTQVMPSYVTKLATLPQHVTHSVYTTYVHTDTYSKKAYYTMTVEVTQTLTETVCPVKEPDDFIH